MKIFASSLAALILLAAITNGDDVTQSDVTQQFQGSQEYEVGQVSPASQVVQEVQQDDPCTLSGTYINGTDVSQCSTIIVESLSVPAGVMLDLTNVTDGASIKFQGTTTFGPKLWEGPLIKLKGNDLSVTDPGTLDGQGVWYWPQGQNVTRPVFFRLNKVVNSKLSGFTIKNMPYRTFSVIGSNYTTISELLIDSRAGNGSAKNTDGFDLSCNDHITITGNTIYNQDDCLAMQSSTNTFFTNNHCYNSHGISVGSLGGNSVDRTTTVSGLTVQGNHIHESTNGLRIKTIIGLKGLVSNVKFIDNELSNVDNAIVVHSDYSKSKGGYTGAATSQAQITGVTVSGLTGTAKNLYDIEVNPKAVSGWKFSGIQVKAAVKGKLNGVPVGVVV